MPKSKAQPTEVTLPDAAVAEAAPRLTKQQLLIDMLGREGGATLAEIVAATGWQSHTVHGAMSGALKKRLGLTITSVKIEGRGRVYRIDGQPVPKWHSRRGSAGDGVANATDIADADT